MKTLEIISFKNDGNLALFSHSFFLIPTGGYMQPGARENIAYLTQTERRKDFQYEAMQERRDAESVAHRGISAGVPTNFKDLIQTKAEENNIVFMPLVAKRHEGKQLYTFGRIVIYIDRGVVFVQGEKTWVPTSLQSLIDMAKWGWTDWFLGKKRISGANGCFSMQILVKCVFVYFKCH